MGPPSRHGRRVRIAARRLALGGLLVIAAACSQAAPAPTLPVPSGALVIRAEGSRFAPGVLSTTADQPTTLYFDNADSVLHNVVLAAADGARVFTSDVFSGPAQRIYEVAPLDAGTYTVLCDVHPEMRGSLTVAPP